MAADWSHLIGRRFQTIQGTAFMVVNVTDKSIIIQPAGGKRRYDVSIADELERALTAYQRGEFFPKPADLLYIGVRHERNSYVWGIAHALVVEAASAPPRVAPPKGLVKVNSSMVYALEYDESKQTLEVVFWRGGVWRYEAVTRKEYDTLMKSPSLGSYMRDLIDTHSGYELRYGR